MARISTLRVIRTTRALLTTQAGANNLLQGELYTVTDEGGRIVVGTGVATSADMALKSEAAPLASPAFTGSPTAPTAAAGDSSTLLATTAFVQAVAGLNTISTTGGTTYLTLAQMNAAVLNITGTLTSGATLVFSVGSGDTTAAVNTTYVVSNNTTGAFTLTLQACGTSPGTTLAIAQGKTAVVIINGTNVVLGDTANAPIRLTGGLSGKQATATVQIPVGIAPRAFSVTAANCYAQALAAATGSTTFTLKKQTTGGVVSTVGTFIWSASGKIAAVSISTAAIAANDLLYLEGPATADATLSCPTFLVSE